jgi:beta-glucosidase
MRQTSLRVGIFESANPGRNPLSMNVLCMSVCRLGLALTILPTLPLPAQQEPHALTAADEQKIDSIIHSMTLEEKLDYIGGTGFAVRAVPSVKLPALEMSDGPYGTRSNAGFPSTTYAAGIGLAASWDPALAERVGAGIGRDARARGVNYMLGPGVNIYRSPRNGRNFEYFGEDPFLASKIAVGYITGMQQQGVSSTIKHYLANNSEFLRHDSDSIVDERALRELYLPTFEAAVKTAHVGAVMDSYNLINGLHATQNGYFNTEILRKEWGFRGTLMSDWDATYDAVGAANGGLDIEMPTGKFMNRANLEPAIKAGTVKEATIDEKIRHILSTAASFGWLDRPQTDTSISYFDAQNDAAALDSARESAVLLKNDGHLLPLNKGQLKTLLVVGPDAYPGVAVGGGSAGVVPFHLVSPAEGIAKALGTAVNVQYDRGLPTMTDLARMTTFTTAKKDGKPGLTIETFPNGELSGPATSTNVISHISIAGTSWQTIVEDPESFMSLFFAKATSTSRRFTGYYTAEKDDDYIVVLEGPGEGSGNRMYLDDKLLIDDWKLVRAFQPHLTVHLTAGLHKVVVEDLQTNPIGGHLRFAIVAKEKIVSQRAIELASKADVVVVAAGYQDSSESEGGDRTFSLPYGQDELVAAMAAANKKTIVDVTSGGNVDSNEWLDKVPVLLESWYGGQEGGTALAEILLGEVNPSGHLPATFERHLEDNPTYADYYPEDDSKRVLYKEGIFVGYRGYEHNHIKPLFPFGYGLSYTTFKFGNLSLSPDSAGSDPHVTVSFDLTNTGERAGAQIAQVYVSEDHAKVARPAHELKGFARVQLASGETKHVSVDLDSRAFAYYDVTRKSWTIDPGKFTIYVGDSVENLELKGSMELTKNAAETAF